MLTLIELFFIVSILISSLCVVLCRNPIHSLLFLIFLFINAACLMVLLGAEYIGMLTIIVYVGAVMVLFLFVIMTIDLNFSRKQKKILKIAPVTLLCSIFFVVILYHIAFNSSPIQDSYGNFLDKPIFMMAVNLIAKKIYVEYFIEFQITGIILLLTMISTITLLHKKSYKQKITNLHFDPDSRIKMKNPSSGYGIDYE